MARQGILTSYASKQLTRKTLYLAAWERDERIAFEKIEDTLPQKIRDDTNMISKVEAVPQMNTLISICLVVGR